MRHTKIVATLGPASSSPAVLDALIAAGVDVFRLNFSHGTHDSHATAFRAVREAAARARRHVAILQDLSGPKIRTGRLAGGQAIELREGDELRIAAGEDEGRNGRVFTPYADLITSAEPGARLLLDDGKIELRVVSRQHDELITTVVNGGSLGEHKGINAPGVKLPASAVTAKDADDLRFGLRLGVDLVALSFVQTPDDVETARSIARAAKSDVPIIAKIERPQALEHLDEILAACEGVMVARGDLGLEMPLERVPRAQKEITRAARQRGIPVIVATQVLESMTTEARPTRAEVTDAAHAVDSGVDAIMLAGETAAGAFPARAVQTLDAIIRDAESSALDDHVFSLRRSAGDHDHARALCAGAVTLAERGDVQAIVAVTRGGTTARRLSALRPRQPILATTNDSGTARRLTLYWGVVPVCTEIGENVDSTGTLVTRELVARGLVAPGVAVVLVSIDPDLTRLDRNYLKIQRLP